MAKTAREFDGERDTSKIAPTSGKVVKVRVLKRGDGMISTGEHHAEFGETYYEWKEEFEIAESIAHDLEARDLVEIMTPNVSKAEK